MYTLMYTHTHTHTHTLPLQVLGDQLAKRGSGAEALRPMLMRILADVQERLIYRCQAFIKECVIAYAPSPQVCTCMRVCFLFVCLFESSKLCANLCT